MRKVLHICIIIVIITAIIFTALMLILRYDENGETNMPFNISKISIISTTDAQDVEDQQNKWDKLINQNNDIYIYIDKNEDYKKTETIEKIVVNNFKIITAPSKGEISIYKPSSNEKAIFENKDELKITEIEFLGEQSTDLQNLRISNQGGIIAFRCANNNLGTYISNDDEEIKYADLLKKINISDEVLKAKISFDICICLDNGKEFQSTIQLDVPVDKIVDTGEASKEITDLNIIFKRIEN